MNEWQFKVITLGCQPVPSHTGEALCEYVREVLKDFFPDIRMRLFFSCHDGAANMKRASQLLKVDNFQHCVAHALHLLLTKDSLHRVPALLGLVEACKNIVTTLHFKKSLIETETARVRDKKVMEDLLHKLSISQQLIDINDQFEPNMEEPTIEENNPLSTAATATISSGVSAVSSKYVHTYQSLKSFSATRWNFTLHTVQLFLDLSSEANNVMKQIGKYDQCIADKDIDIKQMCAFLSEFEDLTVFVSTVGPSMSFIPLVKKKL